MQLDTMTGQPPYSASRAASEAPSSGSLIYFAWLLEIVGVSCGAVSAAYTTFGEHFPAELLGWLPALPMVVIAAAELLRIPLAQAFGHKRPLVGACACPCSTGMRSSVASPSKTGPSGLSAS